MIGPPAAESNSGGWRAVILNASGTKQDRARRLLIAAISVQILQRLRIQRAHDLHSQTASAPELRGRLPASDLRQVSSW